jgi:hypothetical protein
MAIGVACLLLPSARASLVFQEGFDYPSGAALAGQGTWAVTTNSAFITVGSGNLSYPDFPDSDPLGNRARIAGQSASLAAYTFSPFSASVSSGTVYTSFLLNFNGTVAGGNYTFMGLLPYAASGAGNGGNFNNTYDPCDLISRSATGGYQLGIRTLGQGTTYGSTLSLGATYLIVMKYDFTAHKASLFINPGLTVNEPGTPSVFSLGTTSAANVDQVYLRIGGVNQGNYVVDNMRVGTTWVDVIPEPTAAALMGLGVLGLGLARRSRR